MIINMTTIAVRKHQYLDQTLESLFRSDGRHVPVNLILGSSDASHVEKYRDRLNIVPWTAEDEARAKPGQMRHNCNVNALRALRYGDDEQCLCCEDDIRFKPDWFSQLMLTIAEIGERDYVLNLGQGSDPSPGRRYAVHPRPSLVGAQAIYYPNGAVRRAVADYLEEAVAASLAGRPFRGTNDHLIGRWAKEYAALYNTTPMLVGHIGQVSSFSGHAPPPEAPKASAPPKASALPTASAPRMSGASAAAADASRAAGTAALQSATAEVLLDLLRAFLGRGVAPDATRLAECEWPRLAQIATAHDLRPIVHGVLQTVDGLSPQRRQQFKAAYVVNVFRAQLVRQRIAEIGAACGEDGIAPTLLNESAVQRLYADPALRVVNAVDVLVDATEIERASARLQRLGLTPCEQGNARRPSRFHLLHRGVDVAAIPVDVHWRLAPPYRPYAVESEAVLARAHPPAEAPPNVLAMAPEHELALLCLRTDRRAFVQRPMTRHGLLEWLLLRREGERLAALVDIALCVQRASASIDWDALVDTAHRWAADGQVGAALLLVQRLLDVEPPAEVLRALNRDRPRFVDRVALRLELASFEGRGNPSVAADRLRRVERSAGLAGRAARVWSALFPPHAYLRARAAPGSTLLGSWARHGRVVVPMLWAEARARLARR